MPTVNNRPRYQQIAANLRYRIRKGELGPGAQLPTEPELCETYGASRTTIRNAISVLQAEGLVIAEHGRGTFVRSKRFLTWDGNTFGSRRVRANAGADTFTTLVADQGIHEATQDVRCEVLEASDEVAALLNLEADRQVLARRRIMFTEGEPSMIGDSYYPWLMVAQTRLPNPADIPEGDDQELENAGHVAAWYDDRITMRMPTPEEADTLLIGPGVPVGRVTRVSVEESGARCELYEQIFPGDRYQIHYEIPSD